MVFIEVVNTFIIISGLIGGLNVLIFIFKLKFSKLQMCCESRPDR